MVTKSTVKIIWTLHFQNKRAQVIRPKVRTGSVEELLASLKKVENLSSKTRKGAAFLHLDIEPDPGSGVGGTQKKKKLMET